MYWIYFIGALFTAGYIERDKEGVFSDLWTVAFWPAYWGKKLRGEQPPEGI